VGVADKQETRGKDDERERQKGGREKKKEVEGKVEGRSGERGTRESEKTRMTWKGEESLFEWGDWTAVRRAGGSVCV